MPTPLRPVVSEPIASRCDTDDVTTTGPVIEGVSVEEIPAGGGSVMVITCDREATADLEVRYIRITFGTINIMHSFWLMYDFFAVFFTLLLCIEQPFDLNLMSFYLT